MSAITTFTGGRHGRWRIVRNEVVAGEPLRPAERLDVAVGRAGGSSGDSVWLLRGIPSYERYVNRRERAELEASSPPLGRPEATRSTPRRSSPHRGRGLHRLLEKALHDSRRST